MAKNPLKNFRFGAGKTSYWGFSIDYDHWCRSFTIAFIHWFVYVEYWKHYDK